MRAPFAAASRFLFSRQGELWRDQSQGNTNTNECSHELYFRRLVLHEKHHVLASLNAASRSDFSRKL
jgi:hypothetical protein